MDKHGYPTDEELEKVVAWVHDKNGWFEYIVSLWNEDFGKVVITQTGESDYQYELVTGGWSGNEQILNAMEYNFVLYSQCWMKSERGGLHVFEVKDV